MPLRCISLLLFVLLCTCVRAQETEPTKVPSEIKRATVYLQGAQVEREATQRLTGGQKSLVLTGLTAKLDPASVQVTAGPEVTILSVSHRLDFFQQPENDPDVRQWETRIEALDRRTRRLQTEAAIDREEEAILKANRQIAGTDGVDAADLERAVRFQRDRIAVIRMNYLTIQDSLSAIAERRKQLSEQIAARGREGQRDAQSELVVVVKTDRSVTAPIKISYVVPDAGWVPHYDVRVADISQPVDLRYRARVFQSSAEDWKNARLTLSTGNPSRNGNAPELPVWRVAPGVRPPVYRPVADREVKFGYRTVEGVVTDENLEALIGATVVVQGTEIGTVTDVDGNFSLDVPAEYQKLNVSYIGYESKTVLATQGQVHVRLGENTSALDEVVVTGSSAGIMRSNMQISRPRIQRKEAAPAVPVQVQRQATTTNFVIELPYSIPSDGKNYDVDIRQFDVPADFHHFAVPKLSPDAYLTAALTDWEQYDLISGDVHLFFEGTFLGDSYLDVENTSDTLELSLGRDPAVIVTRTATEDYRKKGGILSGRRAESRGWTIAVRNTKQQPIRLTLLDQVPVSGQSNIDVEHDFPGGTLLDEEKGHVRWELNLAAREEEKIQFGYTVKYPKGERVFVE